MGLLFTTLFFVVPNFLITETYSLGLLLHNIKMKFKNKFQLQLTSSNNSNIQNSILYFLHTFIQNKILWFKNTIKYSYQ